MSPLKHRERSGGEKWGKERAMEVHTQKEKPREKQEGSLMVSWVIGAERVSQEGGWRKEVTEEES